ncbi:MAG: UPF0149 family protein [Methylococcales bacterium]|nr:UPF0149 family protein [Methylococcales bacterium]MBT7409602.1 UPF0149 family protein [Methylococcales bacterium]
MRTETKLDVELWNYQYVNSILEETHVLSHASEAHGILCGLMALKSSRVKDIWLAQLIENWKPGDSVDDSCEWVLDQLFKLTVNQLEDDDFGFQLLLPDVEDSMIARTEALSFWCHGYLYGLGISGVVDQINSEVEGVKNIIEFIHDLQEITKLIATEVDEDDSAELAYMELEEYVRFGVMSIWEFVNDQMGNRSQTLH